MTTIFSSKQKVNINDNHGILDPSKGGSGLSSYNKGDLIFASDAYHLSKLPIEEDGSILGIKDGYPAWQKLEATLDITHNNMLGIQGGNETERYHLSLSELYDLDRMEEKVKSIHLDGYISKDQIIVDVIRVGMKGKIPSNSVGYLLPDYSESDEEVFTYIAVTNCKINKLMTVVRKPPGIGNSVDLMVRVDNSDTKLCTSMYDLIKANSNLIDTVNVYTGNIISIRYITSEQCESEDMQVIIQVIFQ